MLEMFCRIENKMSLSIWRMQFRCESSVLDSHHPPPAFWRCPRSASCISPGRWSWRGGGLWRRRGGQSWATRCRWGRGRRCRKRRPSRWTSLRDGKACWRFSKNSRIYFWLVGGFQKSPKATLNRWLIFLRVSHTENSTHQFNNYYR